MESAFAAALCHLLKISEFLSLKIFSLFSSGTVPIISCHCENDKKKKLENCQPQVAWGKTGKNGPLPLTQVLRNGNIMT